MTHDSNPTVPIPEAAAEPAPAFGWNRYAERINGRFAMVGFVALLLLELVTGQTFFSWLGWR
ncbi:chlorophyll a/b-binding protein [Nodosilinea sp. FACHB-13]|uniref:chlorophyll a/b-binding protein n=1 Tax=Cyanophyceae TaxID=3028117 RepID=UPI001685BDA9|nr:chlorophyll a/b-binding protein [Nodosilinea sp. FACHB-13]MBD2108411.1 chlorophyll A-B-binding protein [Nodosilinea sp. FACHB-13]